MKNVSPSVSFGSRPLDATTRRIFEEFRTTYADCLVSDWTDEQWQRISKIRRLEWKADQPIS